MEIENKNFDEAERIAAEILGLPYDHFATEEKKFVTGINCTPENAKEIMLSLLEDTDSSDIQAYHGYIIWKRFFACFLIEQSRRTYVSLLVFTTRRKDRIPCILQM